MDLYILTLFYVVIVVCIIYPPTEFVAAGFTVEQLFESYLSSENINFISYHMQRITLISLVHASLPLNYVYFLYFGGIQWRYLVSFAAGAAILPLMMVYAIAIWWENDKIRHPVVKSLIPYATAGSDWRVVAAELNTEFRSVEKVSVQLSTTSKFIATQNWLIKVTQYGMNAIKQNDCTLVATATDSPTFQTSADEVIQYLNIEVIPSRRDLKPFAFRISTAALRDVQPLLANPVRIPEHILMLPSIVERFIQVFTLYVNRNPVYIIEEEPEQCIGCMQSVADVKLNRRCAQPPPGLVGPQPCVQCNCRVLWCCSCIARWWVARANGDPAEWLSGRCTCPVCRATFCLLDVCPARVS